MGKIFNFSNDNKLKLTIEGNDFYVDASDPILLKHIEEYAVKAQEIGKELQEVDANTEHILKMLKFMGKYIDIILGDGACKQIFKNNRMNVYDAIELLTFVLDEISKFNNEKLQGYIKE